MTLRPTSPESEIRPRSSSRKPGGNATLGPLSALSSPLGETELRDAVRGTLEARTVTGSGSAQGPLPQCGSACSSLTLTLPARGAGWKGTHVGDRSTTPGSAQQPPDDRACAAEIDDAGVALAQRRHHLAEILDAGGSGLGDRGPRRRFDLALIELARAESFR